MANNGRVRIGISGWTYKPWRGVFYPKGLPQGQELAFAARLFASIEINGTFYRLQRPDSFARWVDETPDDFQFAIKGSRYITHMLRLTQLRQPLANFFASGLLRLGPKLGPILWQFPPSFRFRPERLEPFLALLPRDTDMAASLASEHDKRVAGRAWPRTDKRRRIRHAIEIRHDSFRTPAFIRLLRARGVALVCADTVAWPRLMDLTADFVYCRLHGDKELYVSGYGEAALEIWSRRVAAWVAGREPRDAERVIGRSAPKRRTRDVFVYFDNDAKVRAPRDALGLMTAARKRLGRAL